MKITGHTKNQDKYDLNEKKAINWHQRRNRYWNYLTKILRSYYQNALKNNYEFSWNKWKIKTIGKEIEVIKKDQVDIVELKNTITEIKKQTNSNRVGSVIG